MQEDFGSFRRFPAMEKKISDIGPEDIRVCVIGTIVDKSNGKVAIDDGTGSMEALFDEEMLKGTESGNKVRVIGKVSEGTLNGEAIQDFSNFNFELHEKIKKMN